MSTQYPRLSERVVVIAVIRRERIDASTVQSYWTAGRNPRRWSRPMKASRLIRLIAFSTIFAAGCGARDSEVSAECTATNHCHWEQRVPTCDAGYAWASPQSSADFRCVPRSPTTCGNGTLDPGEACDLGSHLNTGEYGGCNQDCTSVEDPCDPNPCTAPHRTVCSAVASVAQCSCDEGFADEGADGCKEVCVDPTSNQYAAHALEILDRPTQAGFFDSDRADVLDARLCGSGSDWYVLALADGERLELQVVSSANGVLSVDLLNSKFEVVTPASGNGLGERFVWSVPSGGWGDYFLRVSSDRDVSYQASIEVRACDSDCRAAMPHDNGDFCFADVRACIDGMLWRCRPIPGWGPYRSVVATSCIDQGMICYEDACSSIISIGDAYLDPTSISYRLTGRNSDAETHTFVGALSDASGLSVCALDDDQNAVPVGQSNVLFFWLTVPGPFYGEPWEYCGGTLEGVSIPITPHCTRPFREDGQQSCVEFSVWEDGAVKERQYATGGGLTLKQVPGGYTGRDCIIGFDVQFEDGSLLRKSLLVEGGANAREICTAF